MEKLQKNEQQQLTPNIQIQALEPKVKPNFNDQETFFFGEDIRVTLINPESVEPASHVFQSWPSQYYQETFKALAAATRSYHNLEMKLGSLDVPLSRVENYLFWNKTSDIVKDTGVAYTTIDELKKGKRNLKRTSVEVLEKLYVFAIKKEKRELVTIKDYLFENEISEIVNETGIPHSIIKALKSGKGDLKLISLESFKTLYACAIKKKKTELTN